MVKQRTTFQLESLEIIDTDNLVLNEEEVSVPGSVFKNRQDRITIEANELPQELLQLFSKFYQLRVQWSSFKSQPDTLFQNYRHKGFSADLVPADANYEPIFDQFGQFIKNTFNIEFNHKNIISTPVSANFHSVNDLKTATIQKFMRHVTPFVDLTLFIDDFEIVWTDQKLQLQWTSPPNEATIKLNKNITKEIAFFQTKDLEFDLEVSGIRTVLSQDNHTPPTKTLLFVKPRHHSINHHFDFEILEPAGLHPTLKISNFHNLTSPNPEQCELFIHSVIEKSLIFDKYQYDKKSLSLINSWGENDLEAPIWNVDNYGSIQLFQVNDLTKDIEIKYHSRYLEPSQNSKFSLITPQIFWACDSSNYIEDYELIGSNPFDNVGLGYESLFEDPTIFYHYQNKPSVLDFKIPNADAKDSSTIQAITLITILLGSIYIIKKLSTILFTTTKEKSQ